MDLRAKTADTAYDCHSQSHWGGNRRAILLLPVLPLKKL